MRKSIFDIFKSNKTVYHIEKVIRETGFDDPKFPCFTKAVKEIKETEGGRESMCKIMEEYAKEYAEDVAIDTTIETALKYNATKEQIVQDLVEKYGLDSASAQKRIEEFINNPE